MDKAGVEAALKAAGLARVLKDLDAIARPSIRARSAQVDEKTLKPDASRLGGLPDLPSGVSWPEWQGLPQSFIAQINLAEVQAYDSEKLLPPQGMLWFFYDAKQETYGAKPGDRGGWQVLYSDADPATFKRASSPANLPAGSQFHACALTFSSEYTLSQIPSTEIASFDWTDD